MNVLEMGIRQSLERHLVRKGLPIPEWHFKVSATGEQVEIVLYRLAGIQSVFVSLSPAMSEWMARSYIDGWVDCMNLRSDCV